MKNAIKKQMLVFAFSALIPTVFSSQTLAVPGSRAEEELIAIDSRWENEDSEVAKKVEYLKERARNLRYSTSKANHASASRLEAQALARELASSAQTSIDWSNYRILAVEFKEQQMMASHLLKNIEKGALRSDQLSDGYRQLAASIRAADGIKLKMQALEKKFPKFAKVGLLTME